MTPPWTGRQLDFENTHPVTLQSRTHKFDPTATKRETWASGSIAASVAGESCPRILQGGMTLVNWPQNDYWLGNLFEVPAEEAAAQPASRQAAQPVAALLAADRSAASRRRHRLEGAAAAAATSWAPKTAWPSIRTSASRAASRPSSRCSSSTSGRPRGNSIPEKTARTARRKLFPTPWASGTTASTCTRAPAATTTSTSTLPFQIPLGALIPAARRKPAARLQEHRHHAHHQRLLPAASRRMEHRRIGGRVGGVVHGKEKDAAPGARGWRIAPAFQNCP